MAGVKQITCPAHVKIKISEIEKLGRNANIVCNANAVLIEQIKNRIENEELEIGVVNREKRPTRNDPYKMIGINADSINYAIRTQLRGLDNLKFETSVEHGGFFERCTKSNFDFSFYDRMYNYCQFWNHNCNKADFQSIISSTIQESNQEDWTVFLNEYNPQDRTMIEYQGVNDCNIVGEIQMGNWALIYKDIFRLIRAKNSPGVNLYIYITNTGLLNKKLSDNVVCYDKAYAELKENLDIIDVPILILGIDIAEYDNDEFIAAHELVCRKKVLVEKKIFSLPEIENMLSNGISIDEIEEIAEYNDIGLCYEGEAGSIERIISTNGKAMWQFNF